MPDAPTAATTLTPSELVFLRGDEFAPEAGRLRGGEELLTSERKVASTPLAEAILTAALLAGEQAGRLRLKVRTKKLLFGLMTRPTLYAQRAAGDKAPGGSIEAQLTARLPVEPVEVSDLIYATLETHSSNPEGAVIERVRRGLAHRQLLEVDEVRKLKIFTSYHYRLAPGTAELVRQQPADGVKSLLQHCERERPELWQQMRKHISSALARRIEQTPTSSLD